MKIFQGLSGSRLTLLLTASLVLFLLGYELSMNQLLPEFREATVACHDLFRGDPSSCGAYRFIGSIGPTVIGLAFASGAFVLLRSRLLRSASTA